MCGTTILVLRPWDATNAAISCFDNDVTVLFAFIIPCVQNSLAHVITEYYSKPTLFYVMSSQH